ncbi:hypothetical protein L227DRAFT_514753 [Lentinus tigrinus ALCF2SS1-6]|uniref:Integrase core domain-containing protein n=1 Tax=Lentinus tigrinus ALCF2SS1-6 TaxID=1328759 RepID=A0A5C2RLP2_9APHY|nr:hypothetical protein L227DRAFT_514753 [Lentinus tigrinus ALCF2SS1-6]
MEATRGLNRGSYIWGRSVHNTRIERLWFDVTSGFGAKWKTFFLELEQQCGLDPDRADHLWLLHHLFLHSLNQDAQDWAQSWNAHTLHIQGERAASPRELFMFGMVRHGPRGMDLQPEPVNDPVDDLAAYGVDWAAMENQNLMRHHAAHNPSASRNHSQPFTPASRPEHLHEVTCDPPRCPLTPAQVSALNAHLAHHFDLNARDMLLRRRMWSAALDYCQRFFGAVVHA